tara:strand:- start:792 stop:1397 length:606 start_codon:yes stop_codon:yes gene_type:complete
MGIGKEVRLEGKSYYADTRDRVAAKTAHLGSDDTVTFNHPVLTDGRPMFGSYYGLSFANPVTGSNACLLRGDTINAPLYNGGYHLTANLPTASVGTTAVFLFSDDPKGGTNALSISCAGSDIFETGCTVPTTEDNDYAYDTSVANETTLAFTPTDTYLNFLSFGSTIEFICANAGKWFVHVNPKHDGSVTSGSIEGTLLFT